MKTTNFILAIVFSVFLMSCGNTPDMNEQEGISEVEKIVKSKFGEDMEINMLMISSKSELNSDFFSIYVDYLKDEVDYERQYIHSTETLSEEKKDAIQSKTTAFVNGMPKQVKISELDFSLINKKYKEAIALLEAESLQDFHLQDWFFSVNKKGKVESSFTIHATKAGDSPSLNGRRITSNYYEVSFTVKEDGTLELQS